MLLDTTSAAEASYRGDLGDGLVLRWSTPEDTESIAQLTGMVFRRKEDDPPGQGIMNWVRALMRGDHPLMGSGDYGVVEDTRKEGNRLVACTCLLRQQLTYEGVPFWLGRPEIVACDPAYRNHGLIRALFGMVHARSQAEGHLVQGVTGIPYFYRQFGYEYALDLGGQRGTLLTQIPKLKESATEPYTLREATENDIPAVIAFYNNRRAASTVWAEMPEHYLRYQFAEWQRMRAEGKPAPHMHMVVDAEGVAKGNVYTAEKRWWRAFDVFSLDFAQGINLAALLPSVLRGLRTLGEQAPTDKPDTEPFSEIRFHLGRNHPVYDVLGEANTSFSEPPYAWYIRVADLPAFLRLIAPALEKRLAASIFAGYTGEIKIDRYRDALRLVFDNGTLTTVEPWQKPTYNVEVQAGFPPLVLLQLVFGHRSLDDLRASFPDVWANNETVPLLNVLFPHRPSYVLPL